MGKIQYVDSHAHLMGEEFQEDFDEVLARIEQQNINHIMIITLHEEEALRAIEFAKTDPERYVVATGIFPEDVKDLTEEKWNRFVEIASKEEIACIGEIGLEYHWESDPIMRQKQRELFIRQIELAKKLNKPFAVHSREAIQDTFDILKEHQGRGLIHCFPGTKEMAKEFTKLGYYIALGGALTFKNARHTIEVVESIDPKYLLTETDCPYMAPVPLRGKRNEPAYIPYILQKMAEVKNVTEEEMAQIVQDNWQRFLEKPE